MIGRQVLFYDLNNSTFFVSGFFLVFMFVRTICLGLALNHDPPVLCLLSSQDYMCEPLMPGRLYSFVTIL
jgi:hypothetical protein